MQVAKHKAQAPHFLQGFGGQTQRVVCGLIKILPEMSKCHTNLPPGLQFLAGGFGNYALKSYRVERLQRVIE